MRHALHVDRHILMRSSSLDAFDNGANTASKPKTRNDDHNDNTASKPRTTVHTDIHITSTYMFKDVPSIILVAFLEHSYPQILISIFQIEINQAREITSMIASPPHHQRSTTPSHHANSNR